MTNDQDLIAIQLEGKNPELFKHLLPKLNKLLEETLSTLSGHDLEDSTKQSLKEVVSAGTRYLEARLKKPSLENEKILAEIASKYAEAEEKLQRSKKLKAETESIELENARKKLSLVFEMFETIKRISICNDDNGNVIIVGSTDS